jgi:hypothetical protein
MPRYMIVRKFTVTENEMPAVGRRSKEIVVHQYPQIIWEHSHVVVDDEGKVRTYCVYAAPTAEIVIEHSARLGQHVIDSIEEIAGDVTPADFPPV